MNNFLALRNYIFFFSDQNSISSFLRNILDGEKFTNTEILDDLSINQIVFIIDTSRAYDEPPPFYFHFDTSVSNGARD